MDNIIIVNDIPFSKAIHNWYSVDNIDLFDVDFAWESSINIFTNLMPKKKNSRIELRTNLNELTCGEFHDFVLKVMMLMDGLDKTNTIPVNKTTHEIRMEIDKIKKAVIYWALIEGVSDDKFGALDPSMIEKEYKRTDRKFHFKFYYIVKNLYDRVDELEKIIDKLELHDINTRVIKRIDNRNLEIKNKLDDMCSLIRKAYKGDLESFIIETINKIQFFIINRNHEKLAQLIRYEFLEIPNFEEELPHFEIWRFLYSNYFDGFEDVFDEFLDEFTDECIDYYMSDYLNSDFDIHHIPLYSLYYNTSTKELNSNILAVLNVNDLKVREKDIYSSMTSGGIPFKDMPINRY